MSEEKQKEWVDLIEKEANNLSLPIDDLPCNSLNQWLFQLYNDPFHAKLYAFLVLQPHSSNTSEEAACLLLAPESFCQQYRLPISAKLLRPLPSDMTQFSDAFNTQCEFQYATEHLDGIWLSEILDKDKGQCIEAFAKHHVRNLSKYLYDMEYFLGKAGCARHAITVSFASEFSRISHVCYQQDDGLIFLQQIERQA